MNQQLRIGKKNATLDDFEWGDKFDPEVKLRLQEAVRTCGLTPSDNDSDLYLQWLRL